MSPRVAIVDYGRGNLRSISRALETLGAEVTVSSDPAAVAGAERLLLPGVGAFADGMQGLRERGLVEPLRFFRSTGRPFLGICLGMQLLMTEGTEFGPHPGLDLVPGRVLRLPEEDAGRRFKVPHVGWNRLQPSSGSWAGTILEDLPSDAYMYFVHSFAPEPDSPGHRLADTRFGSFRFCSALKDGSLHGVQFHPEKSGEAGLALLRNWLALPLP